MSNKKVINIPYFELTRKENAEIFIRNMGKENSYLKDGFLCIETNQAIYRATSADFLQAFKNSLESIYTKQLKSYVEKGKVNRGTMPILCQWTSPVFEQLGLTSMINFVREFKERLKSDRDYYEEIREVSIDDVNILEHIDLGISRVDYIDRFIDLGIFSEEDKVRLGYYIKAPVAEIKDLLKSGKIEEKDIQIIVSQIFSFEREIEDEKSKKGKSDKRKFNSRIVETMNLLETIDILESYLEGFLSIEELERTKIKKSDILSLPYTDLIQFMEEKNSNMPDNLRITSKDLVNNYGRRVEGDIIYRLASYGFMDPEDLINIFEINKALVASKYDGEYFDNEELKKFYSPQILFDMKQNGKLTPDFIQKYLELQNYEQNKAEFSSNSKKLVKFLQNILDKDEEKESYSDRVQDNVLYFFNIGFCDVETARENISRDYIESKFFSDELSIEQLFELYQKGLIDDEMIAEFYTDSEIVDLYKSGQVNGRALKVVSDKDLLTQEFVNGNIQLYDFVSLYLFSSSLTIDELSDAFELSGKEQNISDFIDEKVPFEKIKELFTHLLIDYSTILNMNINSWISNEELEELRKALSTRELFEDINQGKKFRVITERENEKGQVKKRPERKGKDEEDFSLELGLISKILGKKDVEAESFALIESYNSKGRATSLNNYRVFGNENLDGIVILQKSKKENAVFVMSALQLMYFLKGKENESGEIEIQDRMRDKAYLKTIVGVEVIEHTRQFARNLVEASSRVSAEVAKNLKDEDKKYQKDVELMISALRERYDEGRTESRE